jgi:hypothetical protein
MSVLATERFPFNPILSLNLNRALIWALYNDTLWINIIRMITRSVVHVARIDDVSISYKIFVEGHQRKKPMHKF